MGSRGVDWVLLLIYLLVSLGRVLFVGSWPSSLGVDGPHGDLLAGSSPWVTESAADIIGMGGWATCVIIIYLRGVGLVCVKFTGLTAKRSRCWV